ncbi:MAG: O-acetylhomoserine aminocarboxypropyltransferase/cysteine synthase [Victivallaceae bacterium]|nr:O-acetylhomoserine aminocarboxypropyltransferase/cysteine synthase [Victivallaceae bacterium]
MTENKPATLALHAGFDRDPVTGACAVPIYQTASYVFESAREAEDLFALRKFGNIYSRLTNPTAEVFEKRLAALEGGSAALSTSSGMAAIFLAVTNIAAAGDHLISSASLYGGTQTLFEYTLPRFGIEVTFVDELTPAAIAASVRPNTRLVYGETIGNPKGDVPDFTAVTRAAHEHGLPVIIDNTFAPVICKPLDHGVDIVVYSCTKWIGGHGTSIGGIIIDGGKFDWGNGRFPEFTEPDPSYHGVIYREAFGDLAYIVKARVQGLRNIGSCPSPVNIFLLLQGVETLSLRMKEHCRNAEALAEFLKHHPRVEWVSYLGLKEHPSHALAAKYLNGGFGSVFGFGIRGGEAPARRFIDAVQLAKHLANVGDARTLVIHPWTTTHQQLSDTAKAAAGVNPGFIRVSVGIEDITDIIADFDQALAAGTE